MSVFPNPLNEKATVHLNVSNENFDEAKVKLFDLSGKAVQQFSSADLQFSIERNGLETGVYILEAKTRNQVLREKIIIKK